MDEDEIWESLRLLYVGHPLGDTGSGSQIKRSATRPTVKGRPTSRKPNDNDDDAGND